jgi:hypothetical protein
MMPSLITRHFNNRTFIYDGTQLAPHWIYRAFAMEGDVLVSFCGGADVPISHMVDLEDVMKNAPIYSPLMLHFLAEWFIDCFDCGILMQHHFVLQVYLALLERGITGLSRRGNDLYFSGRKLSVSICTRSTSSVLMHFALNIDNQNTPIPTACLGEIKVEPHAFAQEVLERFQRETAVWRRARVKVSCR